jgi:predicted transcriptional regulator
MEWYIKLHRQLLWWEWYDDINTKVLFIHLLLKANHKKGKWRGIDIYPWEHITWRISLSDETWLTQQQIRTSLNKLKSTNEITIKTTNKYSIIKLNKWDDYQQSNQQDNQQSTNNQPTSNHKQEWKECKNEKKEIYIWATRSEVLEELKNIITYWNDKFKENRKVTPNLESAYLWVRKKYAKNDISQALWKYTKEKLKTEEQYWLDPIRFFTQKNWFITYL